MSRKEILVLALLCLSAGAGRAQLGPCATPVGPLLPDLIVDRDLLAAQIFASEESFGPNSCTVKEGCVSSAGKHLLLRFMFSTPNVGQADLNIGDPDQCLGALFQFSECHQHYHFTQYADYRLWTEQGYADWLQARDLNSPTNTGANAVFLQTAEADGRLRVSRKQGFCVIDIARYWATAGPAEYQSCSNNQGLTIGWADQYGPQLACQFLQITDFRDGVYVLEEHVNAEHLFPESNYANNTAAVRISFSRGKGRRKSTVQVLQVF